MLLPSPCNEDTGMRARCMSIHTYLRHTHTHGIHIQASKVLVHDLDLSIDTPEGTRRFGNSWTDSAGAYTPDRLNNAEQITLEAPTAGLYTVSVNGFSVSMGTQRYALVVTGDAQATSCTPSPTPSPTASTPLPTPSPTASTPLPTPSPPPPTRSPTRSPTRVRACPDLLVLSVYWSITVNTYE
jgi:hypothetical protein